MWFGKPKTLTFGPKTQKQPRPTIEIMKGDAVVLSQELIAEEKKDSNDKPYFIGVPKPIDEKAPKAEAPFVFFDALVGIFMGMKYVAVKQHLEGALQQTHYEFLFNDRRVFIEPKYIRVVGKLEDSND